MAMLDIRQKFVIFVVKFFLFFCKIFVEIYNICFIDCFYDNDNKTKSSKILPKFRGGGEQNERLFK